MSAGVDNRDRSGNDIRFVLNSHGPRFEVYSLLCIRSIRRVCGPHAKIRVYQPVNLPPASANAMRFYERNHVEVTPFRNEFLPDRLDDLSRVPARHLTFNKLYCVQDLEPGERRLFVDADIVFLQDPRPYFGGVVDPIACPSVDTPEAFGGDWQLLYRELDVPFPKRRLRVWETYAYGNAPEPAQVEMVPYFSSGVLYVDSRSRLPTTWLDVCRTLESRTDLVPKTFFIDQIALSVAVHKTGEPWTLLPKAMNCTFEVWRYTPDVQLFHYVGFDTLAAAVARFPDVGTACREIIPSLAREDGVDLRFQLLTQWPRWYRRARGIALRQLERLTTLQLARSHERT